jgi:DNA primase
MFSEEFLRSVLARVDIVDVVNDYLPLRKYKCLCPFHTERHASFSVVRGKQFYHCFGCGANGNVFSFLMEYLHISYPQAVVLVCERYRIPVWRGEVRDHNRETARKKRSRVRRRAHRRWVAHMEECTERAVYDEVLSEDD